jgi:predicted ATPase with chaperone activity
MATVTVECDYQEGKLMLARRLTTILPTMTLPEAIETIRIHSVAGLTGDRTALVTTRPFRTCSSRWTNMSG